MRNVAGPTAFALLLLALAPSCVQPFHSKSGASTSGPSTSDGSRSAAARSGQEPQPAGEEEAGAEWSFGASAYTYFVPGEHGYVQPTITADRDQLHLEARYNYEALDAGSLWVGWNFAGGEELAWEITPMFGVVFNSFTGVAPGYKGSLAWWKLELFSEGEYVFDTAYEESFFYNWSELTIAPADWLRLGVVAQRTAAYEAEHDLQRGLLVGATAWRLDFTAYVFNLDESEPTVVVAAEMDF